VVKIAVKRECNNASLSVRKVKSAIKCEEDYGGRRTLNAMERAHTATASTTCTVDQCETKFQDNY
jgi:hypothetical protein